MKRIFIISLLAVLFFSCSNEPTVKPAEGVTLETVFDKGEFVGFGGEVVRLDDPEMAPVFEQMQDALDSGQEVTTCLTCRCSLTYVLPATTVTHVAIYHYVCTSGRHVLVFVSGSTVLGGEVEKGGMFD